MILSPGRRADKLPGRVDIALAASGLEEVPKGLHGHLSLYNNRLVYDRSVISGLLHLLL